MRTALVFAAKAKARENEPDADAKYAALAMGYRERYQQSRGTPATGKPPVRVARLACVPDA